MSELKKNATKNQHFIAQTEQRLNAINPDAPGQIYEMARVGSWDSRTLKLRRRPVSIENNLSGLDLFTYDTDGSLRSNLEDQFRKYEDNLKDRTLSLLEKLADPRLQGHELKGDLANIYAAKMMNMFRNPFSVNKVLNTLGARPKEASSLPDELKVHYEQIMNGGTSEGVGSKFGITDDQHRQWVGALFWMLTPDSAQLKNLNKHDEVIAGIFNESVTRVDVYTYDGEAEDEVCLLSDRGYTEIRNDGIRDFCIEFNLAAWAFVRFRFVDKVLAAASVMPKPPPRDWIKGQVLVSVCKNDREALESYNCHSVDFCHAKVYCARKVAAGVTVEG